MGPPVMATELFETVREYSQRGDLSMGKVYGKVYDLYFTV